MMLRDLSYALRQLRKAPGFTITAVLTLAFGIGATAAIFSIVEGVLLRPLPFPQPNHLAVLSDHLEGTEFGGNGETGVTIPEIAAYRRGTSSFASLGGFAPTSYEFSGAGAPEQINAARMTASMFSVLGVAPTIGRAFTQQEDDGSVQVAVLSYSMWHSRFGADPQIPGRKILLDRKPYEIIGVMPRDFEFPLVPGQLNRSQLWVPLSPTHDELTIGAASWCCGMVGRLKPGVTPAQAQQDAERVAQEIMRNYPAFMTSLHISAIVHPLSEDTVAQARPLIRTLFLAVVVVLFIACANLAGLLLVRVLGRRREVAVRLALGASPATVVRQMLLETLALSICGGLLGLGLAAIALRAGLGPDASGTGSRRLDLRYPSSPGAQRCSQLPGQSLQGPETGLAAAAGAERHLVVSNGAHWEPYTSQQPNLVETSSITNPAGTIPCTTTDVNSGNCTNL